MSLNGDYFVLCIASRVLYSSQSRISNFESHPESREALYIFKALQLRRELILLAGYLARINISKFMIADRVARFRRTVGPGVFVLVNM